MSSETNIRTRALRLASEFFYENNSDTAFKILGICGLNEEQIKKIQEMISASGLASTFTKNPNTISNIEDRINKILATHLCFSEPFTFHEPGFPSPFYSEKSFEFGGRHYTNLLSCVYAQRYTDQPDLMDCCSKLDTPEELKSFAQHNPMTNRRKVAWENSLDVNEGERGVWMHACRAQFGQNPDLKKALMNTSNLFLVCDGPTQDSSNEWDDRGENRLGRSLMKLREEYGGAGEPETVSKSYKVMIKKRNMERELSSKQFTQDVWGNIVDQCDATEVVAFSCLNKNFQQWVPQYVSFLGIETLMKMCGPSLKIIFTGLKIIPEFDKFGLIKGCHTLRPIVENRSLTLMIKEPRLNFREIQEIAKQGGITVNVREPRIVGYLDSLKFTEKRSVMLITNGFVTGTRNQDYPFQYLRLRTVGCEMQTAFDLITLSVFTKLDHGKFPWDSSTDVGCCSVEGGNTALAVGLFNPNLSSMEVGTATAAKSLARGTGGVRYLNKRS